MNGEKKRKKWEFFQDEWNNIHLGVGGAL